MRPCRSGAGVGCLSRSRDVAPVRPVRGVLDLVRRALDAAVPRRSIPRASPARRDRCAQRAFPARSRACRGPAHGSADDAVGRRAVEEPGLVRHGDRKPAGDPGDGNARRRRAPDPPGRTVCTARAGGGPAPPRDDDADRKAGAGAGAGAGHGRCRLACPRTEQKSRHHLCHHVVVRTRARAGRRGGRRLESMRDGARRLPPAQRRHGPRHRGCEGQRVSRGEGRSDRQPCRRRCAGIAKLDAEGRVVQPRAGRMPGHHRSIGLRQINARQDSHGNLRPRLRFGTARRHRHSGAAGFSAAARALDICRRISISSAKP